MKSLTSDLRTSRKVASAVRQGGREERFDVEPRSKGWKMRNDDDDDADGKGNVQEFSGILGKASLAFSTRKYAESVCARIHQRERAFAISKLARVSHLEWKFQSRDS